MLNPVSTFRGELHGEHREPAEIQHGIRASMRPRSVDRGEPEQAALQAKAAAELQCGHGRLTVENPSTELLVDVGEAASMRPRSVDRGEPQPPLVSELG